jgi:hypothetical protein
MFQHIEKVGARVVMELPDCCEYWRDERLIAFFRNKGFQETTFDGCMHGLVAKYGENRGIPIRKTWRLLVTVAPLVAF